MIRDFFAGVGLLLRGFGIVLRTPRLLLLGALPAVLTGGLLLALVIVLAIFAPDLITWATPFLDGWDPTYRALVRDLIGVALVVAVIFFGLLLFAAVTLAVGAPFYEAIANRVENQLGGVSTEHDTPWWTDTLDNAKVVGASALLSVPMFLIDLVPGIGEVAGPIIGVCVSAWLFGLELSVVPFSRRGLPLAARRHVLGQRRAMAFGFALPAYLLCLVPLLALVVMPAATAGGTLLAHRLLEEQAQARS
ncbi:EI24 domain-containing protein [Kutzneria sp. NPDC052558]|uniref:EI24 domain-containing protein n=1 Tax=Kutzneria sp. NPDC052558 TaxID=3364121 RepID=UPI0037CA14A4